MALGVVVFGYLLLEDNLLHRGCDKIPIHKPLISPSILL